MITEEKAFEIIEEFYKEIQSLEPEGILTLYVIGSAASVSDDGKTNL